MHEPSTRTDAFTGPLFLVGMPRSGTKLLRSVLNQHPRVSIPEAETEFLPLWHARWTSYGDLSNPAAFSAFYQKAMRLPYFTWMRELQGRAGVIGEEEWRGLCKDFSLAGVFEALMRHGAGHGAGQGAAPAAPGASGALIWGDKSPSYVRHIPLLLELFPQARVVHIVRDVRDHCLSMHKAWGKNMLRAAQRWREGVLKARRDCATHQNACLEIRFEDLLSRPEETVAALCSHLDLDYSEDMLVLQRPSENIGDARGATRIVAANQGKYRGRLAPETIEFLEALALEGLKAYGYPLTYAGEQRDLPGWRQRLYQAQDGLGLLRAEARDRGYAKALVLMLRTFFASGNRA